MTKGKHADSALVQTFLAASKLRQEALAAGDSREDADAIVTNALKAAWPKSREKAWTYEHEPCLDTGWEFLTCPGDTTCGPNPVTGRPRVVPHAPHDYVRPCYCPKGRVHDPKSNNRASTDDDLAGVGRTRKSKPTRFSGL